MRARLSAVFAALALGLAGSARADPEGLQHHVVFNLTTPLAGNAEIARRALSPLAGAELARAVARAGKALADQSVDLGKERFEVYVPPAGPAKGYGLLVFVPPESAAYVPADWIPVLDREGVILVAADRTGNPDNVLGRRIPIPLLAVRNITARYKVDPERVWIGGFSGGSRMAERLALAYPDVFRGAFMNAGSDPLGGDWMTPPIPPKDLLHRFQETSRLVYVTGRADRIHLDQDALSMPSLRRWCLTSLEQQVTPFVGHDLANGAALAKALAALDRPGQPDPRLADCRAGLEKEVAHRLDEAEALARAGKPGQARKRLMEIDQRYGGLAAPRSVQLWEALPAS
ncbi:MAG: hypothetical protein ACXWK0_19425 [Caulobacteraceae bacterium]